MGYFLLLSQTFIRKLSETLYIIKISCFYSQITIRRDFPIIMPQLQTLEPQNVSPEVKTIFSEMGLWKPLLALINFWILLK